MNKIHQPCDISRVLSDILAYLADHPDADDTIEGIAHWWLLEQSIKQYLPIIEKALTELVDKGFVLEHRGRNGRSHYRLNRKMQRQIKAFLDQRKNDPDWN